MQQVGKLRPRSLWPLQGASKPWLLAASCLALPPQYSPPWVLPSPYSQDLPLIHSLCSGAPRWACSSSIAWPQPPSLALFRAPLPFPVAQSLLRHLGFAQDGHCKDAFLEDLGGATCRVIQNRLHETRL